MLLITTGRPGPSRAGLEASDLRPAQYSNVLIFTIRYNNKLLFRPLFIYILHFLVYTLEVYVTHPLTRTRCSSQRPQTPPPVLPPGKFLNLTVLIQLP